MEYVERRKLSEVLTLYSLHPERNDIYVEGITDSILFSNYLEKSKLRGYKIFEIDSIDFSEVTGKHPELKRNMKRKIIKLSKELENAITNEYSRVTCIIDKDFDAFKDVMVSNKFLSYTDYTCIEMYLFNSKCLNSFFKNFLNGFPIKASKVIKEICKPIEASYYLRLALETQLGDNEDITMVDIKKSLQIDKASGDLKFDEKQYILKVLSFLGVAKQNENIIELVKQFEQKKTDDIRNQARGHDFIHILFLYVDNIKNNIKLNEKTFEKALFNSIDYCDLDDFPLFQDLKSKCA